MARASAPRSPAVRFAIAAALLIGASAAMFAVSVRTATAERDLEQVDDDLVRLQSFSTSLHKFGELNREKLLTGSGRSRAAAAEARREVLAELAELRRIAGRSPGWYEWLAELEPIVRRRLADSVNPAAVGSGELDGLSREIDRRVDALQEDELAVQQSTRRQSRERRLTLALVCALVVVASLAFLAAIFGELSREMNAHQEAAEKFSKAFYSGSLPMAIISGASFTVREANLSFERLIGRTSNCAGLPLDDAGLAVDGRPLSAAVRAITKSGPLRDVEAQLRGADGETRHLLLSADRLALQGEACSFVCFYDITERKRAEAALRGFAGALVRAEQRERRRLAQILHDNLQQTLAAAAMHLNMICRREADAELRESAVMAASILKEAAQTTRALSYELCPPDIARASLGRSLQWLGEQMLSRHKLEVSVAIEQDPAGVPDSIRDFCLGATRELLFNVVKHAGTNAAALAVSAREGSLRVEVSDRGAGFDPDGAPAGLGLAGIRERVRLFGGRLEVRSRPSAGALIALVVPLAEG